MVLKTQFISMVCLTGMLGNVACGREATLQNANAGRGTNPSRENPPAQPQPTRAADDSLPSSAQRPDDAATPPPEILPSPTPAPPLPSPVVFSTAESLASPKGVFRAKLVFEQGPFVTKESIARIEFSDPLLHTPINLSEIEIKPWMSVHGHGAPTRNMRVQILDSHTVQVSGLVFVMSGPWELQVSAFVNGQKDQVILPLSVP
jgi:hypothetical protein